jgi:hypothetical protein
MLTHTIIKNAPAIIALINKYKKHYEDDFNKTYSVFWYTAKEENLFLGEIESLEDMIQEFQQAATIVAGEVA